MQSIKIINAGIISQRLTLFDNCSPKDVEIPGDEKPELDKKLMFGQKFVDNYLSDISYSNFNFHIVVA